MRRCVGCVIVSVWCRGLWLLRIVSMLRCLRGSRGVLGESVFVDCARILSE